MEYHVIPEWDLKQTLLRNTHSKAVKQTNVGNLVLAQLTPHLAQTQILTLSPLCILYFFALHC